MRLINIFTTILLMMALSSIAYTQTRTGSVNISGYISGTVALSAVPNVLSSNSDVEVSVSNISNSTIRIFLSGSSNNQTEVNIPVQIRSNTSYELTAITQSSSSILSNLRLASARATGQFVTADAIQGLIIPDFSNRHFNTISQSNNSSTPFTVAAGPRISKAGTLSSPHNAIEVTLAVNIKPIAGEKSWTAELTLTSSVKPLS
jgi:hypothetical protein